MGMGIETGKKFFERAYRLGDRRIEAGLGWPIKGVGNEVKHFFNIIKRSTKSGKVLDLGCGDGRISIYFAQNGFKSYGIDFAKGAIDRAKKVAKEAKVYGKTDFRVGNVLALPYHKNFFDVAVDWSVFDHLEPEKWDLYLKNLLKVLKPKGFYMLTVFSTKTPFMAGRKKQYYSGDAYFHFFDKVDIINIFGKHFKILKVIKTKSEFPPPFIFYNALMRKL